MKGRLAQIENVIQKYHENLDGDQKNKDSIDIFARNQAKAIKEIERILDMPYENNAPLEGRD